MTLRPLLGIGLELQVVVRQWTAGRTALKEHSALMEAVPATEQVARAELRLEAAACRSDERSPPRSSKMPPLAPTV